MGRKGRVFNKSTECGNRICIPCNDVQCYRENFRYWLEYSILREEDVRQPEANYTWNFTVPAQNETCLNNLSFFSDSNCTLPAPLLGGFNESMISGCVDGRYAINQCGNDSIEMATSFLLNRERVINGTDAKLDCNQTNLETIPYWTYNYNLTEGVSSCVEADENLHFQFAPAGWYKEMLPLPPKKSAMVNDSNTDCGKKYCM